MKKLMFVELQAFGAMYFILFSRYCLVETVICLEATNVGQMFSVDDCLHHFCVSCMKQHVEVKLFHGMLPKCPQDGCTSELKMDSCRKFLTPKLIEIMSQRIREASIPVSEKVYCPYPKCAALMPKSEVLEYSKDVFYSAESFGLLDLVFVLNTNCFVVIFY
ncbi:hypothetical protein F0562_030034 [Nyssa sinensis]|uniref:Zinc finger C3HC4 RING-type domain-containing protein n=1 Tax=Nyssa sinensis TaxID=561372 RepID=A0A5J5B1N3_9ASTE|nr:hypothetical protein F0562_030034 [Nyssa sinensis]